MDFLLNGAASGPVAQRLLGANFDPRVLRPYVDVRGRTRIMTNRGGALTGNVNATLRKDEWLLIDDAVTKAAKPRLRAVADLRSRGLQMVIPNGLGVTVLQTEAQSDISAASISMDAIARGTSDRPEYALTSLPLPIIHKDFFFSTLTFNLR